MWFGALSVDRTEGADESEQTKGRIRSWQGDVETVQEIHACTTTGSRQARCRKRWSPGNISRLEKAIRPGRG